MVWVGVICQRLKRNIWNTVFILRVVGCCEQGYILIEIGGTLETNFLSSTLSKSVSELKLVLGLCRILNIVVDLLQEAPYFFAAWVKSESDSGVNQAEKKKIATCGNPLQNYGCLLQLVELIPLQPKKLNIKKSSMVETLAKSRLLYSVAPPLLDFLRRPRAA